MKVIWEEVVKEKEKAVAKLGRSIEKVIKTTTSFAVRRCLEGRR